MATMRQRLLKDKPVVGEGPTMCSASQKPFKLNDVVYTFTTNLHNAHDWNKPLDDDDYDPDEPRGVTITAHRVIQLNYQHRYVRIRCANGCETTVPFGEDACSKTRVFHDLDQLKTAAWKVIYDQVREEKKKREKYDRACKNLEMAALRMKKMKITAPQAIA